MPSATAISIASTPQTPTMTQMPLNASCHRDLSAIDSDEVASSSPTAVADHSALINRWVWTLLGSLMGLLVQSVTVGAHAFILVQEQRLRHRRQLPTHDDAFGEQDIVQYDPFPQPLDINTTLDTAAAAAAAVTQVGSLGSGPVFVQHDIPQNTLSVQALVFLCTHLDCIFYVAVWCLFVSVLTGYGKRHILPSAIRSMPRIVLFNIGCNVMVGTIAGSFLAWMLMDLLLGLSMPLGSVGCTVGIDCVLCYVLFSSDQSDLEDDCKAEDCPQQQQQQQQSRASECDLFTVQIV